MAAGGRTHGCRVLSSRLSGYRVAIGETRQGAMDDVAIYIPAKGRSTGIANKNLAEVGGRPLFLWSIECGLSLVGPRQIFVSTDSDVIARGATELGATVLARPRELAADDATVA